MQQDTQNTDRPKQTRVPTSQNDSICLSVHAYMTVQVVMFYQAMGSLLGAILEQSAQQQKDQKQDPLRQENSACVSQQLM